MKIIIIILRILVAFILLQSLYFKFGGHAEAVHIFSTLGVEPWGRLTLATIELIVGIGILIPKTHLRASFLATGLMVGAIGVHLFTPVGINVQWSGMEDNGQLFFMAIVACLASLSIQLIFMKIHKIGLAIFFMQKILISKK